MLEKITAYIIAFTSATAGYECLTKLHTDMRPMFLFMGY